MKKLLCLIILFIIPLTVLAYIIGDVDGNGKIEVKDYIAVRKHLLKIDVLTGDALKRADANNNGTIEVSDYIMIRKMILGMESTKNTEFQIPLTKNDGSPLIVGDPYVIYYNGYYYFTSSNGTKKNNKYTIRITASKNLQDIGKPEKSADVWINNKSNMLWAPELHHINNRWYIYYTDIDDTKNSTTTQKRMYVLRSKTDDPLGEYELMGKIYDAKHDYYALDGTVLQWNNELYYIYSGSVTNNKTQYNLYIARMKNPYQLDGERVTLSQPEYAWEKKQGNRNEGPAVLIRNNSLHIVFSANDASSEYYCLGMLTYKGSGSLLSKSSWKKSTSPVFQSANGVYAPGHNSFTTSPDGKEDWIVYHAYPDNKKETIDNWRRSVRIQKVTWNGTTPVFGKPLAANSWQTVPSGSK